MKDLMSQPPATLLPADPDADEAIGAVRLDGPDAVSELKTVAARYPAVSAAWARLAEIAYAGDDPVTAYAFARTGYHRGLDQLRRNGWRGFGPVPWSHVPNQGFLRSVYLLGGPRTRSARPRRPPAARSCCATVTRPPPTRSPADRSHLDERPGGPRRSSEALGDRGGDLQPGHLRR